MTERILFHSVFLQCPSCNVWGTPFPNDTECGNCGNSDATVTYVSQEDSNAQAAEKVREALDRIEKAYPEQFTRVPIEPMTFDDGQNFARRCIQREIEAIRKELLANDPQ